LSYLFYVYLIGDVTLDGISKCNSDNDTQVQVENTSNVFILGRTRQVCTTLL
jgi:hypothetical protein